MKIVCISDTHNRTHGSLAPDRIPEGDVLVHAGDMTAMGSLSELESFTQWLGFLPHKRKVIIAGNHDFCFEHGTLARAMFPDDVTYLQDSSAVIDGVKFYGSPHQPEFFNWAFNLPRGERLAAKWAAIDEDTNVLVTHGPPYGVLDGVPEPGKIGPQHVGCKDLMARVRTLKHLKLHVFGHIHLHGGLMTIEDDGVRFVNAACCDERYFPSLPIRVVEL